MSVAEERSLSVISHSHACIVTDLTPIATIDWHVGWTYPPVAFGVLRDLPKWEGASRLMILLIFQGNVVFEEALASPS